ncbi:type III pantothenate kinase [bacterium]|nr:type III pantothenate kinase [bacterium]
MSTLLLDIGNTRAKAAWLGADGSVGAVSNYEFGNEPLADWLNRLTHDNATGTVWASNVGGEGPAGALNDWAHARGVTVQLVQSRSKQLGVRCAYADPTRLGVDRWMVVLAAAARKTNCLIVDAGTACTIDAVDATGQHLGGLILPGVRLARSALNQRTNFQADDVATDPLPVLGDDTNPAVTLGAVHALLGAIDRVCAGLDWADFDGLLTGGEASVLAPHLGATWVQQPDLVLQGVARVACQDEADLG